MKACLRLIPLMKAISSLKHSRISRTVRDEGMIGLSAVAAARALTFLLMLLLFSAVRSKIFQIVTSDEM